MKLFATKLVRSKAGQALLTGLIRVNHRVRRQGSRMSSQLKATEERDMSEIQGLFETMAGRFNSDAAAGLEAVFQYKLDEGDAYYVAISGGECALDKGLHDNPSVVLMMDSETFKEVLEGETNGMQAFMAGRIRAEGDVMLATRLEALFPAG
ncbi:SCP2 sterol-binding domain-containing protein [Amphritea atlantica]|jgi:putative sterol carrier protein|nr:SCP2 sterol-binding domain-containing protein [Amphritea atlantica]